MFSRDITSIFLRKIICKEFYMNFYYEYKIDNAFLIVYSIRLKYRIK